MLHNDSDPNLDPFTAALVTGPTNGTLTFHADGTFVYSPKHNWAGTNSFTYQDTDSAGAVSNIATATITVAPVFAVDIVPTAPAATTSVTALFTFGGAATLVPFTSSWASSPDGVTWTTLGATAATYPPAVTNAPGIFLSSSASYTDPTTLTSQTAVSDPVFYILDGNLGGVTGHTMSGAPGNNIIFANGGDDVITAGSGPMLAYGGAGNDRFVARVGDVNSTYDGQVGVNTYDLSQTSAAATVDLGASSASSAQTGSDVLVAIQNVVGSKGNDTITGDAGNNTFFATANDGNDSYTGGIGTDTYDLSATGVLGTPGATVNLGLGTATSLDTGTDTLVGIENAVGGAGNDTFIATVGDGDNTYNGGAGIDTYDLSATTAAATVNLNLTTAQLISADAGTDLLTFGTIENVTGGAGSDTITGEGSNNVLSGGAGNDSLDGRAGNDTLIGGAGNDTLNGGIGIDTMFGGLGNDTYFVDNGADVVTENVGEGTADLVWASVNYTLAAGSEIENLRANAGATGLILTGNEFANNIRGLTGADTLFGGAGNDTLDGSVGADTMAGGLGNDTYTVDNAGDVVTEAVGEGTDTVNASVSYTLQALSEVEKLTGTGSTVLTLTGNEFDNTIIANGAGDTLNGGAGNDTLQGGGGNDTLNGGDGNDTLFGNGGVNTMAGGLGNDTYFVSNTNDVVNETAGQGSDTIWASVNYALGATSEIEFLKANSGNGLTLTGNGLANTVMGGAGSDTLDGGAGNDALFGGAGNDVFKFLAGFGQDTITDFDANPAGGQDLMDISALGISAANFTASVQIAALGLGTKVTIGGNSINLIGVAPATIDSTDFKLA